MLRTRVKNSSDNKNQKKKYVKKNVHILFFLLFLFVKNDGKNVLLLIYRVFVYIWESISLFFN